MLWCAAGSSSSSRSGQRKHACTVQPPAAAGFEAHHQLLPQL
jgi:hypothetical protein